MTIVETRAITGGVDTPADVHVAAALDPVGGLLGVQEFPATPEGYGRLLGWLGRFGTVASAARAAGPRAEDQDAWLSRGRGGSPGSRRGPRT